MTGFGNGRAEGATGTVSVEIRSVNNRFLDVQLRLPGVLSPMESGIRADLQKQFMRGKLTVFVNYSPSQEARKQAVINTDLLDQLVALCAERGQAAQLDRLLAVPGIVTDDPAREGNEELEALLKRALSAACDGLVSDRGREGALLRDALLAIHGTMSAHLTAIEVIRPLVPMRYRDKLKERLAVLLEGGGTSFDAVRLEQELAIFADKADLAEECTRLAAHLGKLLALLTDSKTVAVGRPLDFLNQEILREINTIGSKARDLDITGRVLELKNLSENLKEQIANLE